MKLRAMLALLALLSTAPATPAAPQAADVFPSPRLFHLERWLKDLLDHVPGEDDRAVEEVRSWSSADSETLRIDEMSLVQLMHDPGQLTFLVSTAVRPGTAAAKSRAVIFYTSSELRRLRVLSCVAMGKALPSSPCFPALAVSGSDSLSAASAVRADELDAELRALNEAVIRSNARGDPNFIFRRGALLHSDAEMFGSGLLATPAGVTGSILVEGKDGQQTGSRAASANWEAAKVLLDAVTPVPDPMVLLWYRATASWMQRAGIYNAWHIDHGSEMFPKSADILFLSGCQHEVYASPRIQALVSSAKLQAGRALEPQATSTELALAEAYFRRALSSAPTMAEARLRLGHVLLARGKPDEAARELQRALPSLEDPLLKFFGELFVGAADERTNRLDDARAAYTMAAQLYPFSQSAPIALSALAARQGDRPSGLLGLDQMFASVGHGGDERDPWWEYYDVQARNTDALLAELYAPFRQAP